MALVIIISSLLAAYGCGSSRQPVFPEESAVQVKEGAGSEQAIVAPEKPEAVSAVENNASETHTGTSADNGDSEPSVQAEGQVAEPGEGSELVDIPEDFFRCEVRIKLISSIYQAQAIGPTLEEARDNAVDEACAVPCAEQIADKGFTEDESEAAIDKCTEACVVDSTVLAGMCWQNQNSVYSEGDWNENGDSAPTNGDETFEIKQGQ